MSKVKPEPDLPDLGRRGLLRVWPQRWRWRVSIILALLIAVIATLGWFSRERIAQDLIDDALLQNGLEATYEIEEIGTSRQIITNLVMGDPDLPDFTAERVILDVSYTYGPPQVDTIKLVRPRLYGEFKDGAISFGSLDPLLFADSEEPAGLPSINLNIVDGRARIASEFGNVGVKLEGAGLLDDGFAGNLAATAPGLGVEGCAAKSATLFGDVTSTSGQLGFSGPVRLREVSCDGGTVAAADIGTRLTLAPDLGSVEGDLDLSGSDLSYSNFGLAVLGGTADFAWRFVDEHSGPGELSLRHNITGENLSHPLATMARWEAEGTLRSRNGFVRNDWTTRVSGGGIDARPASGDGLRALGEAAAGTFAGTLLAKFEGALARSLSDGALLGDLSLRMDEGSLRMVIPDARLRAADGETILSLSRLNYSSAYDSTPERLSGNVLTGGSGLPRINARLQSLGDGVASLRMTMADYREGGDSIAIPRFEARRDAAGRVRFNGMVQAEGAIPGGEIRGGILPVEGSWSPRTGLALGARCTTVTLAALEAYDFALGRQELDLCPVDGRPLVTYRDSLQIAAQVSDVSIAGQLGESPASIAAERAVLRYPEGFSAEGLAAVIGGQDSAVRLSANQFEGSFEEGIAGNFGGGAARLDIVPLDLSDLSGTWSYRDSVLSINDGAFTLTERLSPETGIQPRLEPLRGQGAQLTFADGAIRAVTELIHPGSGRRVSNVTLRHDLATAAGRADISVPGIRFDQAFQPEDITPLTKGVIAFADGVIEGRGEVSWEGEELESSGTFSTDGFDFAAAFGPVRGVSGTITFTDLLNMTTAPSQIARVASVNPGIEALDGQVVYSITNGTLIKVEDGRWPFMGGELILRPVTLDYGGGQGQSYIFEIIALDAATFVAQMELTNLGAIGTFDGTIPINFDAQGNGTIAGGLLISRPPGGNVAYVGELTYEDLGTMGNYAFQTLRSLDYNQMSIELNGNLAGEIVTNFNIDGVRQGDGTSQNFVTRQLAQLPIRFKVNVRSENFYLLATIVRGLFDPTVFGNPIDQGLFQIEGGQFVPRGAGSASRPVPQPDPPPPEGQALDELQRRDEPSVQPPESDNQL